METIQVVDLILLIVIILLCVGLVLGGLYAYQWVMYYIDIGEQYVDDFNATKEEIKQSFNGLGKNIDKISSKVDQIETYIKNIKSFKNNFFQS